MVVANLKDGVDVSRRTDDFDRMRAIDLADGIDCFVEIPSAHSALPCPIVGQPDGSSLTLTTTPNKTGKPTKAAIQRGEALRRAATASRLIDFPDDPRRLPCRR